MSTHTPSAHSSIDSAPSGPASAPAPVTVWSRRWRLLASVVIGWHLLAVIIAPCAADPSSPLQQSTWRIFRPYLEVLFLNHGYHFFAPDPGPGHLVRYELKFADGREQRGYFPDKTAHTPRLLYHRHFMLSEFINNVSEGGAPPEVLAGYTKSFADHLLAEHKAASVKLYLVRHLLPAPKDVQGGMRLDDPSLYREKFLGEFPAP